MDDGSHSWRLHGLTCSEFDAQANYDDGMCTVMLEGCTDSSAHNYRLVANLDDASCLFRGCADSLALNFNPTATIPGPCTAGCRLH